ncbi:MAG: hypothetical protein V4489_01580 [Chlamydiota bacterium]
MNHISSLKSCVGVFGSAVVAAVGMKYSLDTANTISANTISGLFNDSPVKTPLIFVQKKTSERTPSIIEHDQALLKKSYEISGFVRSLYRLPLIEGDSSEILSKLGIDRPLPETDEFLKGPPECNPLGVGRLKEGIVITINRGVPDALITPYGTLYLAVFGNNEKEAMRIIKDKFELEPMFERGIGFTNQYAITKWNGEAIKSPVVEFLDKEVSEFCEREGIATNAHRELNSALKDMFSKEAKEVPIPPPVQSHWMHSVDRIAKSLGISDFIGGSWANAINKKQ